MVGSLRKKSRDPNPGQWWAIVGGKIKRVRANYQGRGTLIKSGGNRGAGRYYKRGNGFWSKYTEISDAKKNRQSKKNRVVNKKRLLKKESREPHKSDYKKGKRTKRTKSSKIMGYF